MPSKTPSSTLTPHPIPSLHAYLHLSLLSFNPKQPNTLDILTAHTCLTGAVKEFLGITGTAIPIDILKVEEREVWIRCPREDGAAIVAAVGGWSGEGGHLGWRIRGRGDWLGGVVAGEGLREVWGK